MTATRRDEETAYEPVDQSFLFTLPLATMTAGWLFVSRECEFAVQLG